MVGGGCSGGELARYAASHRGAGGPRHAHSLDQCDPVIVAQAMFGNEKIIQTLCQLQLRKCRAEMGTAAVLLQTVSRLLRTLEHTAYHLEVLARSYVTGSRHPVP